MKHSVTENSFHNGITLDTGIYQRSFLSACAHSQSACKHTQNLAPLEQYLGQQ